MEVPYEADTNMVQRQWGKFMLNVGVNQTVAVYKSNYGEIQIEGPARDTMISAMREVIALSEKEGIYLTEDDLHYWLTCIGYIKSRRKTINGSRYRSKIGHSEVELFAGTVLELGKKYGVPTPVNKELYDRIQTDGKSILDEKTIKHTVIYIHLLCVLFYINPFDAAQD